MPGLFGVVQLDRRPLDVDATRALLAEMASRLGHQGSERVETFEDLGQGFVIARSGLPRLEQLPWPEARRHDGRVVFLDGMLHRDSYRPGSSANGNGGGSGEPWERETCRRLEGFWSAAFDDGRRTVLATDRRGSRPLVWTVVGGVLYFAPEVKALLAVPGFDRKIDPGAMGLFFASGFLLADMTFFPGASRLEGGYALVAEKGGVHLEPYAEYRFTAHGDGTPYQELRAELGRAMQAAVARNLEDPEGTAIFLSGGKDSRAILASAARVADPSRLRAVSWTSNEPGPGSDVFIARQIAAELGVPHQVVWRVQDDFRRKALRLDYVLDGLTDVGAFHGEELRLMEELVAQGFHTVFRGDQCFTRGRSMMSPEYAILRMCIRSADGLAEGAHFWRAGVFERVGRESAAIVSRLIEEYREVQEDNAGDQVYFRHRLQGYLNQASYFKSLLLDHRNPLLDEALLRFIQRLSVADRHEQKILNEALAESFPELRRFPYAERSNLEDYVQLLAADTPVRRAVEAELADDQSSAWEWLDREALRQLLDRLATRGGSQDWRKKLKLKVKNRVRDAVYGIPWLDTRLRGVYLRRETRADEVLLRALAIKHFFDLFIDGDGSRAAYEKRLAGIAG